MLVQPWKYELKLLYFSAESQTEMVDSDSLSSPILSSSSVVKDSTSVISAELFENVASKLALLIHPSVLKTFESIITSGSEICLEFLHFIDALISRWPAVTSLLLNWLAIETKLISYLWTWLNTRSADTQGESFALISFDFIKILASTLLISLCDPRTNLGAQKELVIRADNFITTYICRFGHFPYFVAYFTSLWLRLKMKPDI